MGWRNGDTPYGIVKGEQNYVTIGVTASSHTCAHARRAALTGRRTRRKKEKPSLGSQVPGFFFGPSELITRMWFANGVVVALLS